MDNSGSISGPTGGLWLPLEANPEVFTSYLKRLEGPSDLIFSDVLSLEDWAYDMLPKPVLALLFVFPLTDRFKRRYQWASADAVGEQVVGEDIWFTKQTIPNACGTVALLHVLLNLPPDVSVDGNNKFKFNPSGPLGTLEKYMKNQDPKRRAELMESDERLGAAHSATEKTGDSNVPSVEAALNTSEHFVAIIRKDNKLYELDGRMNSPIYHGQTSQETFVQDSAKVIKRLMAFDESTCNFSILAVSESS